VLGTGRIHRRDGATVDEQPFGGAHDTFTL
jgi:hypothetical protein